MPFARWLPLVVRSSPLVVLVTFVWVVAVLGARPSGDGGEYLLMTHAFATHASPDIRVADAEWLERSQPELKRVAVKLARGLRREEVTPLAALRRSERGAYFSLHFWLYSLFAVPALWLTEALGAAPSLALAVVNALAATTALVTLWLQLGRTRFALASATLFVLGGTTFYLGWTGPEAFTGAAVVVACVCARRGELGLGCVAAALAAAQNASALALAPFVVVAWRLERRALGPKDLVLLAVATILALLPYAFFYAEFRVPSPLGHFAADPRLISFERAWSLVFDLNQGLLYGMPGVLFVFVAAALIALCWPGARPRRSVARDVVLTLLLVTVMAVPTLAVHNWNAGCSVVIRYGYWLTMPLFVLALELLAKAPERPRFIVLATTALLGLVVVAANGIEGERYRYLRQTWLARLVLRHAPGAYNPVPEVFYERTLGIEVAPKDSEPAIWPPRGSPTKMLAPADHPRSTRLCPDGGDVQSEHRHAAGGDWVYLDAPFRCVRAPS